MVSEGVEVTTTGTFITGTDARRWVNLMEKRERTNLIQEGHTFTDKGYQMDLSERTYQLEMKDRIGLSGSITREESEFNMLTL